MINKINLRKTSGLILLIIYLIIFSLVVVACNTANESEDNSSTVTKEKEITVFAASSLTESLNKIKEEFTKEYPDLNLQLNLASSSRLRVQIEQGVQADLFLSANKKHYDLLKEKGLVEEGEKLLANKLVVVIPQNNPGNINDLQDLINCSRFVIAQEEVPVGNYTLQVLDKLEELYGPEYKEKVLERVVSEENNVKQVLAKVVLGEADAAFVYSSDVTEEVKDKVKVLQIPQKYNVEAGYWAAIVKDSQNKEEASAFYDYLAGEKGLQIFESYGFIKP